MSKLAPYLKAITAALIAGLSVILADVDDLTTRSYVSALVAFLVGLGGVWAIPNKPAA